MADATNRKLDVGEVLAIDATVLRSTNSDGYGITSTGFVAKPFGQLLVEKLALARELFGDDIDLTSGSSIRKAMELSALEEARLWAAIGNGYDANYAVSASGEALSRIGRDMGLPRPYMEARGVIKLTLAAALPNGFPNLTIPRGARLSTLGGHHVATDETVVLSAPTPTRDVKVVAFYPGPSHNLDPNVDDAGTKPQKIDRWNLTDPALNQLNAAEAASPVPLVTIEHAATLTGGELQWSDVRYRQLLLRAPRSVWTVEAIEVAVSLVPGVRQVKVHDARGGLDINQSIFGNFNFIERVFSSERDLGSPYYFSVLVAPTPAAIWDGPSGLRASVESVIDDLRPIGIFPNIESAVEIGVGVRAKLVVQGLPLPTGSKAVVNASQAARALRERLYARLRRYIDELPLGEPVRYAEVVWTMMNEPGIQDVRDLKLVKYPPGFDTMNLGAPVPPSQTQEFACGANVEMHSNHIPVFVDLDDPAFLEIV
jgi:hypothetical protein